MHTGFVLSFGLKVMIFSCQHFYNKLIFDRVYDSWILSLLLFTLAICYRGLSTGIYPTNSAEACYYILNNCRANIVMVEDQIQMDKIAELIIYGKVDHLKAIVQYKGELHVEFCQENEEFEYPIVYTVCHSFVIATITNIFMIELFVVGKVSGDGEGYGKLCD